MNKAKLKTYAPQARKDFIAAVTARAQRLGLTETNGHLSIAPAEKQGDIVIIAGQSWPKKVSQQRDKLIARLETDGLSHTLETVASTWFNRFAALRYMEIHNYLGHGYRALSSREGGLPELLTQAVELAQNGSLPELNPEQAIALKLAGNQDGELYRLTLIAQCNALSSVMPFLFERIDDETELLLPDNLLLTDSVIAKLIAAIPEEDWQAVEIIGWLYQFYISEKKDQVIGKVVKSEDIPAATQLFTPNWIVQYLVQNSVGRLWLMANPSSTLNSQWQYYIEPAEQTPVVQAQLDALIQARMAEDGGSLNPETITVLDPACGSGHILVEAYDVLKAIYLERGYPLRTIPRLILEKNLFGLDIDDRAAQLAGFALLMKARADDRRLFNEPIKLNVLALKSTQNLNVAQLWRQLDVNRESQRGTSHSVFEDEPADLNSVMDDLQYQRLNQVLALFAHAETFGSLIQVPQEQADSLKALLAQLEDLADQGDTFQKSAATTLMPYVQQARLLAQQYDAVVANPPYMGSKGMNAELKEFAKRTFPDSKADLFAMFMERGFEWCKPTSFNAMVTMQSWMFLSSFCEMRNQLLLSKTLFTLMQVGYNSFPEMNSSIAQACAFSIFSTPVHGFIGRYINLNSAPKSADKNKIFLERSQQLIYDVYQNYFNKMPGSPLAYWVSEGFRSVYDNSLLLSNIAHSLQGMITGDNNKFLRLWYEVNTTKLALNKFNIFEVNNSSQYWIPYNKGGDLRKWYGNNEYVLNWSNEGRDLTRARTQNVEYYLRPCITWTFISSSIFAARYCPQGFLWDVAGSSVFPSNQQDSSIILGLMCSKIGKEILHASNPTVNFQVENILALPIHSDIYKVVEKIEQINTKLIEIAKTDWDTSELSWDFTHNPIINDKKTYLSTSLEHSFNQWQTQNRATIEEMQRLEEENNRLFIDAYGLQDELSPGVPEEQITLTRADREKDSQRLISYAIGCTMGRYSLDEPGLIYAHAGNNGFDPDRYPSFPADADGIVPITDELWFSDDAAHRIREFLEAVWGADTLEENSAWLAASLGQKSNETADETLRRYLASNFYKDHLQTYKKRPIYWLFSSGKHGAFQALVYLHRYNESTLARMRAEYVVPLTGKLQTRLDLLKKDAEAATAPATRNKLNKDIEKLNKKHTELLAYDEKLRHYADLRISLDLDDGVKVNYGKFGDLLAEVKAVSGGSGDD